MHVAADSTPTVRPLPDRTPVLDLVRPGLFRKDPENLTVIGSLADGYPSVAAAVEGARQIARSGYADIAIVKSGDTFGLQSLVDSHGPGPGGPFDVAYHLKLQDRDYFRYVHPDLQAVVGVDRLVTRDQLVEKLHTNDGTVVDRP